MKLFYLHKKGIFFLMGCLIPIMTIAQANFLPGQIVNLKGDTLEGFIDYRNWEINPNKIYYKSNANENPALLGPLAIKAFKVENEIYVSAIVNLEVSPFLTSKLGFDQELNIKSDTVFLQTLIAGEKSLYFHKNSDGVPNFFIKRDSIFDLLIYKRFLVEEAGIKSVKENKKYLGQLALYLGSCESIGGKLSGVTYTQKSLIKLFQHYFDCTLSDNSFERKWDKGTLEIGGLMGGSVTSLNFTGRDWDYLTDAGYSPSLNLSTGLFFDFVLPRNRAKWSINNEILFSRYQVNGQYENRVNEDHYSVTYSEFGYSYIKINNLLRFRYPVGKISIFINAGISNGFSLNEINKKREELYFYGIETIEETPALSRSRRYEQGFLMGTGIKYDRFSLETRHETANGMSTQLSLSSTTRRVYVLLGYRFY
jgi:hypothetical protein